MLVAPYAAGSTLSFAASTPVEGTGNYAAGDNENVYYTFSADTPVTAPSSGSSALFTPGIPTLDPGIQNGTVSGSIAIGNDAGYDHATLVVTRFANIVTSVDISSALASGGSYSVSQLPSGTATSPVPGAYYYAYVRLWKAGTGLPAKIIEVPGFIDLRTSNSANGFNVTINVS